MRRWVVTATVPFPLHMVPGPGESFADGLPEHLHPVSRIPNGHSRVGDVEIVIGQATGPQPSSIPGYEYAALRLLVSSESASEALERAHQPLELLLDDLSFQLQMGFSVVELEVLDVTDPVAAGD